MAVGEAVFLRAYSYNLHFFSNIKYMKEKVWEKILAFLTQSDGAQFFAVEKLKQEFGNQPDLKTRRLKPCCSDGAWTVVYLESMAGEKLLEETVIKPLVEWQGDTIDMDKVFLGVCTTATAEKLTDYREMVKKVLNGYCLLFEESNQRECLCFDTRQIQMRAITEPPTGNVSKGPREGFIEDAKTNLSLIKKRIKSPALVAQEKQIGRYTQTTVLVCYLSGITDEKILQKVLDKLESVDIDGIVDSSYLARYMDADKSGFFKTVGGSERPDVVTAKLLEGRVAIIVDGSPIVLTVPYVFFEDLQGAEDYYQSSRTATAGRYLRTFSVMLALFVPSLYVALQVFNYQILPAKFLITIITSTQAIPFRPFEEMLLVLVLFDILREANFRMPQIAGISLSVVGAVVLGDAAVKAGLLGAPAVVIGALSGIGLYAMPDNTLLFSILRIVFLIVGTLTGLFGLALFGLALLAYVISLNSFGSPYFAPFAPEILRDMQDGLNKKPLEKIKFRPKTISNKNEVRQK